MMTVSGIGQVRNNKHYKWLKERLSKLGVSEETKQKQREHIKTEEHKDKIRVKRKLQVITLESNKKRSHSLMGNTNVPKGNIPWNQGIPHQNSTKEKIRVKRKLQVMVPQARHSCVYCGYSTTLTNLKLWHNEMCSKQPFAYG